MNHESVAFKEVEIEQVEDERFLPEAAHKLGLGKTQDFGNPSLKVIERLNKLEQELSSILTRIDMLELATQV